MNGYTHMLVGGLSAGVPLAYCAAAGSFEIGIGAYTLYPLAAVVPSIIGSLGPDIDMKESIGGRWIRKALRFVITVTGAALLGLAVLACVREGAFSALVPFSFVFLAACGVLCFVSFSKHRRETHCGLVVLILLIPNILIIRYMAANSTADLVLSAWLGFCLGWFSHLLADTFNRKGVPWLYPISSKHFHISKVITNSRGETVFRVLSVIFYVCIYTYILVLDNAFKP
ncbi:hypothetical protein AGMMS49975_10310 [Clostridia bacterium]|nr:hypothetical protein AGMMS49975_10310 [Clostridia bacterium]